MSLDIVFECFRFLDLMFASCCELRDMVTTASNRILCRSRVGVRSSKRTNSSEKFAIGVLVPSNCICKRQRVTSYAHSSHSPSLSLQLYNHSEIIHNSSTITFLSFPLINSSSPQCKVIRLLPTNCSSGLPAHVILKYSTSSLSSGKASFNTSLACQRKYQNGCQ